MVMYFQEDYWEAIKGLPEEDRKDAALALIEYHFEGTDGSANPVANAILTVCKKRIDLSKKRSAAKKGKTKREAKGNQAEDNLESKRNQNEIKTKSKPDETPTNASLSLSLSNSKNEKEEIAETKSDEWLDDGIDWENPHSEDADFVAGALEAYNSETGSDLAFIDYATQASLKAIRERGRTVDDLRAVVGYKRRQWDGDGKMERYIRPSTLFGEHFEEYLAEAKRKPLEPERDYSIYDFENAKEAYYYVDGKLVKRTRDEAAD